MFARHEIKICLYVLVEYEHSIFIHKYTSQKRYLESWKIG